MHQSSLNSHKNKGHSPFFFPSIMRSSVGQCRNIRFRQLSASHVIITSAYTSMFSAILNICDFLFSILGPGCSKLTTSLVNVSLNFQKLISKICQYFLLIKCEKLLQCKSFSHFFSKKIQCIWLLSCETLNKLTS